MFIAENDLSLRVSLMGHISPISKGNFERQNSRARYTRKTKGWPYQKRWRAFEIIFMVTNWQSLFEIHKSLTGLGAYLTKELYGILKKKSGSHRRGNYGRFSRKKLNVVVQYYDCDQKRLHCKLLDLVKCTNSTAEVISNSLLGLISETNCDLNKLVGFSADTCNTMFSVNNSVSTILKKAAPNSVLIKCACHSINLTSSYSSKELPKELEELVYSEFNLFARSPETFESFQDFVDCALSSTDVFFALHRQGG